MAIRQVTVCGPCHEDQARKTPVIAAVVEARIKITYPDGRGEEINDSYGLCEHRHLMPVRAVLDALKEPQLPEPPVVVVTPEEDVTESGETLMFRCSDHPARRISPASRGSHAQQQHNGAGIYEVTWIPLFDLEANGWEACGECGFPAKAGRAMTTHENATGHNSKSDKHPLRTEDLETTTAQAFHEAFLAKAASK